MWTNGTGADLTYTTAVSGTQFTIGTFNGTGENYYYITVGCNTTTNAYVNATTLNFKLDIAGPGWDSVNNYTIASCIKVGVNFTANESLDSSTIYYRKHGTSTWNTDTYSTNGTDRKHNITFNQDVEQIYEFNISMTDLAGNVNASSGLINITTPLGICNG